MRGLLLALLLPFLQACDAHDDIAAPPKGISSIASRRRAGLNSESGSVQGTLTTPFPTPTMTSSISYYSVTSPPVADAIQPPRYGATAAETPNNANVPQEAMPCRRQQRDAYHVCKDMGRDALGTRSREAQVVFERER